MVIKIKLTEKQVALTITERERDAATARAVSAEERASKAETLATAERQTRDEVVRRVVELERDRIYGREQYRRSLHPVVGPCDGLGEGWTCSACRDAIAALRGQAVAAEERAKDAEMNFAACAHAIGVEHVQDQGPSYPGPVDAVVRHIEDAVRAQARVGELEVQRDDEFAARLAAERRAMELETDRRAAYGHAVDLAAALRLAVTTGFPKERLAALAAWEECVLTLASSASPVASDGREAGG